MNLKSLFWGALVPELLTKAQVMLDLHPVDIALLATLTHIQHTRSLHYVTRLLSERNRAVPPLLDDMEGVYVTCHRHRDHGLVLIYSAFVAVVSEALIGVHGLAFHVTQSAIHDPCS